MKFHKPVFALISLLVLVRSAIAVDVSGDRFSAARDAVRAGDRIRFERAVSGLNDRDLAAYVEYWRISLDIESIAPAKVRDFLARYKETYVAEKLRSDWLKQLAKQGAWADFDAEYPALVKPDQDVACSALQSRLKRGDAGVLDEARSLWLSLLEPPESCYPVLEALILDKRVLADDVWARIRRQFEAGKMEAARYTMNYLPANQTPEVRLVAAVVDTPLPWLAKRPAAGAMSRLQRELTALAVARIARNDPRMAAEQLEKFADRLHKPERSWAWSVIGWKAARSHLPEALEWYRKAEDVPLSGEIAEWKVRAALRAQEWGVVRATIEKMPAELAGQAAWVYWLGRAYQAGGRTSEADRLFTRISGQPNFYGNLADEELGRTVATPPRAASPTAEELDRVLTRQGVQLSLALFRVDLRSEGVREWNWALRGMNDRDLLSASRIALNAGIYDRAISAADRTRDEHDYELRYLTPYSEQVRPEAKRQALDDAWVYGLMRQESRFVTNARSSVGASGLMQLMPATARWVARKIGLKDFHQGRVNETDTNVLLGTSYMRLVLESLDNQTVLASAAYNAGPGRARKWQADTSLEGAIYAETIPFNETRDYVKKVMSNALYYAALFDDKPQSLKNRLGVINPRGQPKGEELP